LVPHALISLRTIAQGVTLSAREGHGKVKRRAALEPIGGARGKSDIVFHVKLIRAQLMLPFEWLALFRWVFYATSGCQFLVALIRMIDFHQDGLRAGGE
jgi:hypothetical protein